MVVFALVAAFGLVMAVAVNILLTTQEAKAVRCANNPAMAALAESTQVQENASGNSPLTNLLFLFL